MLSTALRSRPPRKGGRPAQLSGGTALRVYLDAATIIKALKLGKGNMSAGLRLAVSNA